MDPLSIGIGATQAVGQIAGGLTGLFYGGKQLKLQQEQFDYQKQLNNQLMQREDTAVQRRAEDMAAAGINKNLAAGAPADASPMSAGTGAGAGAGQTISSGLGSIGNSIGTAMSAMSSIEEVRSMMKQQEVMDTQADLNNAQALREYKQAGLLDKETELTVEEIQKMKWNQAYAENARLPHGQVIIPGLAKESDILGARKGNTGGFNEVLRQLKYGLADIGSDVLKSAASAKYNGKAMHRDYDEWITTTRSKNGQTTRKSKKYN